VTSIEAIIDRQFKRWEHEQLARPKAEPLKELPLPIVTVSRQSGSRGSYFASRLAQKLGYQRIHREVIDAICTSSGYRSRLVEALDENFRTDLQVLVDAIITGQAVDNIDYARHLCHVVLSMSRLGGVVVVGRGSNFILGPQRGFHIRFVCPLERRVHNLITYKSISEKEAREYIQESDQHRSRFVKSVFGADINDPLHYDLVINAEFIDVEELVTMAIEAIKGKMDKLMHLDNDE